MNNASFEPTNVKDILCMEPSEFGIVASGQCWVGTPVMKLSDGNIVCLVDGFVIPSSHKYFRATAVRIMDKITLETQ